MMNEADLDPVDEFIGELVERATQEFVGTLVPVRFEKEYELALSGKRGEAAVRAIHADDFETAMGQLAPAVGTKDDEDGRMSFAAGIVSEATGKPDQALKFYRQAASSKDVDEKKDLPVFLEAKKRLTDHLPRILPPSALKPKEDTANEAKPDGEAAPQAAPAEPPAENSKSEASPKTVDDEVKAIKQLPETKKK
jgi:hypothetical protein